MKGIMRLILLLSKLFSLITFALAQDDKFNKQVFGIESTLDHLIAAVSLDNESTHALAKVPGDNAYQSLMRQFLSTCHRARLTQAPPLPEDELKRSWRERQENEWRRQDELILDPEHSWSDYLAFKVLGKPLYPPAVFDGDPFMEDPEVGVLEGAVGVLKNACVLEMSRMNITDLSDWPFARVVLPDFFWTNIEHQLDPDMYPDGLFWEAPLHDGDLFWLHHLYRKFSTALYRNKYRLDEYTDWRSIVRNSGTIQYMTAASNEIVQHTRKFGCLSQRPPKARLDRLCEQERMSSTTIVVDFSNASLSLWMDGPESEWMPWNTFPELGAHAAAGCHRLDFNDQIKVLTSHLQPVAEKLHALIDNLPHPGGSPVDCVLSGEAWSEASQAALKNVVSAHEGVARQIGSGKYMRQTDEFAASKRVARWARYHVNGAFHCTLPVDDNVPEVSWDTLTGHDEL